MRITALDIRNHRFPRRMGGYDREEVDTFLRMIAEDYEAVLREAQAQRDQVLKLESARRGSRLERGDPPADPDDRAAALGRAQAHGREGGRGPGRRGRGQGREDPRRRAPARGAARRGHPRDESCCARASARRCAPRSRCTSTCSRVSARAARTTRSSRVGSRTSGARRAWRRPRRRRDILPSPRSRITRDGVAFWIVGHSPARRAQVGGSRGGALRVAVIEPPVEGEANAACVKALARALGVPREAVRLAPKCDAAAASACVIVGEAQSLARRIRELAEPPAGD